MEDRFRVRIWDENEEEMLGPTAVDGPPETITMQCTGLKDRNGKLVYEGDIVEYTFNYLGASYQEKSKIIWSEEFSALFAQDSDGRLRHISGKDEYEVIGNIYENPELLESENE